MKKTIAVILILVAVVAVVAILMFNKKKTEALTKQAAVITSYSVSVVPVENKLLDENLTLTGTIVANREVSVVSETNGKITGLHFDIGNNVTTGKILVNVDDDVKKATLANAEAAFEKAKKDLERYEQLNRDKSANDAQLEGARLTYKSTESQFIIAKKQYNDTKIIAPIPGVITQKNVEIGTVVNTGTPIATIIDISSLKIKVNVAEADVFKLKTGDKTEITTDVYPDAKFSGKITNINSKSDDAHTYAVEIQIPNSKQYPLKAGLFAKIKFLSITSKECLTIPRDALVGSIKNPQVYVIENNVAKLRTIEIGGEYNGMLEVKNGLTKGENVVVSGQINLRNDVQVIINK